MTRTRPSYATPPGRGGSVPAAGRALSRVGAEGHADLVLAVGVHENERGAGGDARNRREAIHADPEVDAETTPLRDPEHYQYELDLPDIAEVWRRGSVIASWLLDLTAGFLQDDAALAAIAPVVADSGEGRWTALESVDLGVPTPVMTLALMTRFASQGHGDHANRMLAMMRKGFGGHAVQGDPAAGG